MAQNGRQTWGKIAPALLSRSTFDVLSRSVVRSFVAHRASLFLLHLSLSVSIYLYIRRSFAVEPEVPGLISKSLSPAGFYKQLLEPVYTDSCRRLQYRRKSDSMKRKVREKFLNIWWVIESYFIGPSANFHLAGKGIKNADSGKGDTMNRKCDANRLVVFFFVTKQLIIDKEESIKNLLDMFINMIYNILLRRYSVREYQWNL